MDERPIDVIIPAFNEESSIGKVLADIPATLTRRVVVADNGSTDGSPEEAVGPRKLARLQRAALEYQARIRGAERPCRLDLIAIQRRRDGQYTVRQSRGLTTRH